jgi:hypothetical protein
MVSGKDFVVRRRLEENPTDGTVHRASGIHCAVILRQFAPNGGNISGMGNAD